jgi:hypothetical protein
MGRLPPGRRARPQQAPRPPPGRARRHTFEAIVDGDGCFGYWRGGLDGKPIYVKSAKLGGKLQ